MVLGPSHADRKLLATTTPNRHLTCVAYHVRCPSCLTDVRPVSQIVVSGHSPWRIVRQSRRMALDSHLQPGSANVRIARQIEPAAILIAGKVAPRSPHERHGKHRHDRLRESVGPRLRDTSLQAADRMVQCRGVGRGFCTPARRPYRLLGSNESHLPACCDRSAAISCKGCSIRSSNRSLASRRKRVVPKRAHVICTPERRLNDLSSASQRVRVPSSTVRRYAVRNPLITSINAACPRTEKARTLFDFPLGGSDRREHIAQPDDRTVLSS